MLSMLRNARHLNVTKSALQRNRGLCSYDHLKMDLLFMSDALIDNSSSRFDGQGEIFKNLLSSSCGLALEQFSPLSEACQHFSPSYDAARHRVSHVEASLPAMKKYAELGFCGLSVDFQFGGLQLPPSVALLARMPLLVANPQLAPACARASGGFTALYDFCIDGVYSNRNFPGLDKDVMFTTIANGINYGAVCLSGRAGDDKAANEGRHVQAVEHPSDHTAHLLAGHVRGLRGGVLHEFGDNTYYIVPARLPGATRASLFLVPRFVDSGSTLEEKFRDGMIFDKGTVCNHIAFENVSNSQADVVFGHEAVGTVARGASGGSVGYLIADEAVSSHAISYFNQVNNLHLSVESIACSVAAFLQTSRSFAAAAPSRGEHAHQSLLSKSDNRFVLQGLLRQKAYVEGSLALGVQVAALLQRGDHDSAVPPPAAVASFEFLSLTLRYWTAHHCVEERLVAGQLQHLVEEQQPDRVALSLDFLRRLHGGGCELMRTELRAALQLAKSDLHRDILGEYATQLEAALVLHEEACVDYVASIQREMQEKAGAAAGSDLTSAINSHELALFTGRLCLGWVWLKQGIAAHVALTSVDTAQEHRNFYLGKISTLDYFCNYELVKTVSQAQLLKKNPQILDFADTAWLWHSPPQ